MESYSAVPPPANNESIECSRLSRPLLIGTSVLAQLVLVLKGTSDRRSPGESRFTSCFAPSRAFWIFWSSLMLPDVSSTSTTSAAFFF